WKAHLPRAAENDAVPTAAFRSPIFHRRRRYRRYEVQVADIFRERARSKGREDCRAEKRRAAAIDQPRRSLRGKLDKRNTPASISASAVAEASSVNLPARGCNEYNVAMGTSFVRHVSGSAKTTMNKNDLWAGLNERARKSLSARDY